MVARLMQRKSSMLGIFPQIFQEMGFFLHFSRGPGRDVMVGYGGEVLAGPEPSDRRTAVVNECAKRHAFCP